MIKPPAARRAGKQLQRLGGRPAQTGVLIVVVALVAAACGSSDDSSEAAPTSTTIGVVASPAPTIASAPATTAPATTEAAPAEPTDIVDAFYGAWSAGNVDGALAYSAAELTTNIGDRGLTSGFMDYVVALGQQIALSDCSAVRNGLSDIVICTVEHRDPVVDALELSPSRVRHTVTDGLVTKIRWGPSYGVADTALGSFGRSADQSGFEAACQSGDRSVLASNGIEYSGTCGTFLATLAADAASEILEAAASRASTDPVAVVTAFYDAWDAGDIDIAVEFLSPSVTSPAGNQAGPGLARLRNFMEYISVIPQSVSASDCEISGDTLVTCLVEYRDPVIDALGIKGSNTLHEVENGLLTHVTFSSQYAKSDAALDRYVREVDATAYETQCAIPGDGSVWGELGIAFHTQCAVFLGQYVAAAAATL